MEEQLAHQRQESLRFPSCKGNITRANKTLIIVRKEVERSKQIHAVNTITIQPPFTEQGIVVFGLALQTSEMEFKTDTTISIVCYQFKSSQTPSRPPNNRKTPQQIATRSSRKPAFCAVKKFVRARYIDHNKGKREDEIEKL